MSLHFTSKKTIDMKSMLWLECDRLYTHSGSYSYIVQKSYQIAKFLGFLWGRDEWKKGKQSNLNLTQCFFFKISFACFLCTSYVTSTQFVFLFFFFFIQIFPTKMQVLCLHLASVTHQRNSYQKKEDIVLVCLWKYTVIGCSDWQSHPFLLVAGSYIPTVGKKQCDHIRTKKFFIIL